MAEKLCQIKKKGGGGQKYKETSLWTNQSPTSTFSAQTVTLSESMDNFKYLAFKYRASTGNDFVDCAIYSVEDVKKTSTTEIGNVIGLGSVASGARIYSRYIDYVSSTSLSFTTAYRANASATGDGSAIPLEILGLNELDHGKNFDETVLWTNNAPTSSFGSQTITLSDDIDNYDYIAIPYKFNNSTNIQNKVVYSVSDFKNLLLANSQNHNTASLSIQDSSNNTYCRPFGYVSNTSIKFEYCYRLMSTSYLSEGCIPLSVIGCKFK